MWHNIRHLHIKTFIATTPFIAFDLFIIATACLTITSVFCYYFSFSFIDFIKIGSISSIIIVSLFANLSINTVDQQETLNLREYLFLTAFILLACLLTLFLNRPDADDDFYLGVSVLLLENLTSPLNSLPYNLGGYSFTIHEHVKAALSYLSGTPILYSYYIIIPLILTCFTIVITARVLKLLLKENWIAGLCFFFVIMLAWGDAHRTHANFGLVRMFQGKAVFVSTIVPAMLYYFLKFQEQKNCIYLVLFFATITAGVAFTPTGFIVGPLLAGLLFFPNFKYKKISTIQYSSLGIIALFLFLIWYTFKTDFGINSNVVHTPRGLQQHTSNYEMYRYVMGDGIRGLFALTCFVISPWLIQNAHLKQYYRNYVLFCCILLLIPWTSELIAKATYCTASWRWFWALSFPLAMCIVMGKLFTIYENKNRFFGVFIFLLLTCAYTMASDRLVLSTKNYTRFSSELLKLHNHAKVHIRTHHKDALIVDDRIIINGASY